LNTDPEFLRLLTNPEAGANPPVRWPMILGAALVMALAIFGLTSIVEWAFFGDGK
jgi:hypothetical protein